MIFKSNKDLSSFLDKTFAKGFSNKGLVMHSAKNTSGVVLMKLTKTPLYYMYGWDNDNDYWLLSDN